MKKQNFQKGLGFWSEGYFGETLSGKELKEKMKTFYKGHDEDMNFNCKKS